MQKLLLSISGIYLLQIIYLLPVDAESILDLNWYDRFGNNGYEQPHSMEIDFEGNVLVSGSTERQIGNIQIGLTDSFLRKYTSDGQVLWTTQFGSPNDDSYGIFDIDGNGNSYFVALDRGPNLASGSDNSWSITKIDSSGNLLWTDELETSFLPQDIIVDELGNAYLTGREAAIPSIKKLSANGDTLWTSQITGPGLNRGKAITKDNQGNIYITGESDGDVNGIDSTAEEDIFVSKLDSSGSVLWTEQFGTSADDVTYDITVDSFDDIYITGTTRGNLSGSNAGERDGFLIKLDQAGNKLWAEQFGTYTIDNSASIDTDSKGNVYLTGYTRGSLGDVRGTGFDAYLRKHDRQGNHLWTKQIIPEREEGGVAVRVDQLDNTYVYGWLHGTLDEFNPGQRDPFVMKFSWVPEPSSLLIIGFGLAILTKCRISRS